MYDMYSATGARPSVKAVSFLLEGICFLFWNQPRAFFISTIRYMQMVLCIRSKLDCLATGIASRCRDSLLALRIDA